MDVEVVDTDQAFEMHAYYNASDTTWVIYAMKPYSELEIGDYLYQPIENSPYNACKRVLIVSTVSGGTVNGSWKPKGNITKTLCPYTKTINTIQPIILTAGKHTRTVSKSTNQTATISYGFTYINQPVVICCLEQPFANSNIGVLQVNWTNCLINYVNAASAARTMVARWLAIGQ